jgi:hypothetical protein
MSYSWGPHYLGPTDVIKSYSGMVQLREEYDDQLLAKELEALGLSGCVQRVNNPWYCRPKGTSTWIKLGESDRKSDNFAVSWNTRNFKNGTYEVLGLMHVYVLADNVETAIAGQNIVEVTVKN